MTRLTKQEKQIVADHTSAREILARVGATLSGRCPGVSFFVGSTYMDITDETTWQWIAPLLNELADLREQVKEARQTRRLES